MSTLADRLAAAAQATFTDAKRADAKRREAC